MLLLLPLILLVTQVMLYDLINHVKLAPLVVLTVPPLLNVLLVFVQVQRVVGALQDKRQCQEVTKSQKQARYKSATKTDW